MRFFTIGLILLCLKVTAQDQQQVDSLKSVLLTEITDSVKVRVLIDLTGQYYLNDGSKALEFLDEALEISERLKDDVLISDCLGWAAYIYHMKGDYASSIKAFEKTLRIKEEQKDTLNQLVVRINISSSYGEMGEAEKEIEMLQGALELAKNYGDDKYISAIYNNLASSYVKIGKADEGIKYITESIKIRERIGDKEGLAYSHVTLGYYFNNIGNVSSALENYNKALEIYKELNHKPGIGDALANIGGVYKNEKKYEEAKNYLEQSKEIREELGDNNGLSVNYNNLGFVYGRLGDEKTELEYYEKAAQLVEKTNNRDYLASIYNNIGRLKFNQGQKQVGLNYLREAMKIAEELNLMVRKKNISKTLSDAYKELGDYKNAYEYQILHTACMDSLLNEAKTNSILDLQTKYETEKKEQQIALLHSEKEIKELQLHESQNKLLIAVATGAILILGLAIVVLFINQKRIKASQRTSEMEQRLLRSQMNPHFLFNALNAIQGFIFKSEPAQAGMYLGKFAELIRMILENSRNDYVTLDKEILSLKHYLELQKLRFSDSFDYEIDVDENIDIEEVSIPPMLAQPFIENSIEHGIKGMNDGLIRISFSVENGQLNFDVTDNGMGMQKSLEMKKNESKEHKSLATIITKERLDVIRREYKQKILFDIIDLKNVNENISGTKVSFQIPYSLA